MLKGSNFDGYTLEDLVNMTLLYSEVFNSCRQPSPLSTQRQVPGLATAGLKFLSVE